MSAMWPLLVVELTPLLDEHPGLGAAAKPFTVQQFVTELAVEAFDEPVLPRLPGAMKAGPIDASRSQRMTRAAVNSAPLSDRMNAGLPYSRISLDSTRITSWERRLAPTSMASIRACTRRSRTASSAPGHRPTGRGRSRSSRPNWAA